MTTARRMMRAVCDAGERRWCARVGAHAVMAVTPSWSTDDLVSGRARDANARATREEVDRARALAGLRSSESVEEAEAFAREVEGILDVCGTLDGTATARAEAMWTTRETTEDGGEGLRMRFDASARGGGDAGERELASVDRGRLMREARFANGETYAAPGRAASEE